MCRSIMKVRILNCDIMAITRPELLASMKEGAVYTPNVDHLVKLQNNSEFYKAYKNAEFIVCDSKILRACSFLLKDRIPETIQGSSLLKDFYMYHKDNADVKIFLLGAAEGVAEKAMRCINERAGRRAVVGAHSPSFGFEKNDAECEKIVEMLKNSEANVLVVGVGAPKQEIWIEKYRSALPNIKLFFALGATIDFEAGNIARAPKWIQKCGMEWFFRLMKEPRRLWRRYLVDDPVFFWKFFKQLLGIYKNPFEQDLPQ